MFFKNKSPEKTRRFISGDLVEIEKESSLPNDKLFYVVINYIESANSLTNKDSVDDYNMIGIVWGLSFQDLLNDELHLRLWNPELKNFYIVAEKYCKKILNDS